MLIRNVREDDRAMLDCTIVRWWLFQKGCEIKAAKQGWVVISGTIHAATGMSSSWEKRETCKGSRARRGPKCEILERGGKDFQQSFQNDPKSLLQKGLDIMCRAEMWCTRYPESVWGSNIGHLEPKYLLGHA